MQTQVIRRALRLADREEDGVIMQIEAEISLPALPAVVRHYHTLEETPLDVVAQLRAAVIARRAEIAILTLVPQQLAFTFVVGKTMKPELELDRQLLTSHLKHQFEGLQVRHALGDTIDDQVIPLH